MRYQLDPSVRRRGDGLLLAGGTPPRLLRLSPNGARALDRILAGAPLDPAAAALAVKLSGQGTITPLPPRRAPATELTTVVPVHDGGPGLASLVESLRQRGEVIVVDDRSSDGSPQLAAAAGARMIASAGAPGPAGARNTGLRAARTELVAFVDADCRVAAGWSDRLAGLLTADPRLAVVAPRVRSAPGRSRLARYERRHSPLDLGPNPALVGPGRRVSYLPAAALVARREPLLGLDGFDEALRYGEDVDLIWRLLAVGHLVRYAPQVAVEHAPRSTLAELARQRAGYGSSAAALDSRHPGATAPLRGNPAALAVAITRAAARSPHPASRRALVAIGLRNEGGFAAQLGRALCREWLPLTAAAALASRRGRRLAALALALDLASTRGLRLLDNAAYASGLWNAALRERRAGVLLPRLGFRDSSR